MINFPDSPSTSDTFVVGSITYVFDGSVWKSLGVVPSDGATGPTGPTGPIGPTGPTGPAPDLSAVAESIVPSSDVSFDLGSSDYRWRDLYLSGSTLYLGDLSISSTDGGLVMSSGGLPSVSMLTVSDSVLFADAVHAHLSSDVTNFVAATQDVVTKSYVDGLNVDAGTLDGNNSSYFSSSDHTHVPSEVGLSNLLNVQQIPSSEKAAANGVASLDANGKIPSSQIPSVALGEVFVVADNTARDALTVQEGDIAKVTGSGLTFVFDGSSWIQITVSNAVDSVNGYTGTVSLTTSDVTELNNLYFTDARAKSAIDKAHVDNLNVDADTVDGNHASAFVGTSRTVSAGTGLSGGGDLSANRTISHADTSSQSSVNNSNGTVIQDVTLDTYGHVTALGSTNLDGRYYTETESDARFLGISAKAADADLLDGINSGSFLRSDANDTSSGVLTLSGAGSDRLNIYNTTNGGEVGIRFSDATSQTQNGYFRFRHSDGTSPGSAYGANFEFSTDQSNIAVIIDGSGDYFVGSNKVWNAGNDGSGSGLDADTLDGIDSTDFVKTSGNQTIDGTKTFSSPIAGDITGNAATVTDGVYTSRNVSAGTGLTGGGALSSDVTLSHADTSSQASVNNSGNTVIQDVTLDTYGHVTGLASATLSIPSVANATITLSPGGGMTGGGNFTTNQSSNETITLSHSDTSSQASVNNSGGTVIQDVTLDTYGHVTGLVSYNLDGRYYTESEANGRYYQRDYNVNQDVTTSSSAVNVTLPAMSVGQLQIYTGTWNSTRTSTPSTIWRVYAPSGGTYLWVEGTAVSGSTIVRLTDNTVAGGAQIAQAQYNGSKIATAVILRVT